MGLPVDTYLFWVGAFFFLLATIYLLRRIKKENLQIFKPISVYLGSVASFFVLMGIFQFFKNPILILLASFAIMFGAASITKFPLAFIIPKEENRKFISYFLLVVIIVLAGYNFFFSSVETQLRTAHTFAFITAGLFTIGFILFMALRTENKVAKAKSVGSGVSLGLCCVVSHGLISLQLLPFIAIPLFGVVSLKLPMLFALLSPIAFILVLYLGHRMSAQQNQQTMDQQQNTKGGQENGAAN